MPKFDKSARVTVPGMSAQAVIVDVTETVPGFPVYSLHWLDDAGCPASGTCGEGDLAAANRKDWVVVSPGPNDIASLADTARDLIKAARRSKPADIARNLRRKKR